MAHNRIKEMKKAALVEAKQASDAADGQELVPAEVSPFKLRVWWAGIILVLGGEVGNLLAYGDPNTPASVVTAVGCVGVISNAVSEIARFT